MSDPYQILGISRDATDDEVKKAYRKLCRKYHPDANINKPNAQEAADKFNEVQQAYDRIINERKNGGFGNYGGYSGFGSYGGQASAGSSDEYSLRIQAAANYINSRHFREAINVLNSISRRTAEWYYLSALANAGVGNNYAAVEQAKTAASMDPSNPVYQNLAQSLSGGSYRYDDMSGDYGGVRGTGNTCADMCMANTCLNVICNPCFNPCGCV